MSDIGEGPRYSRIEVSKQAQNFSIAHFTIFSSTEREDLHGHNFQLACEAVAPVGPDGLTFDYGVLKRALRELCDEIDEKMILPANSPHLTIEDDGNYIVAIFNGERLPFLHRDVMTLPIANTTVEEFSHYFLQRLLTHDEVRDRGIVELTVRVSSSPGQWGSANWNRR